MPETDKPSKTGNEPTKPAFGVAELSDNEYHELSDHYLDIVCAKFEQLQDAREDIDVEFSVSYRHSNIAAPDSSSLAS